MKNKMLIIIMLLFVVHFEMKGQLKSELIAQVLKSRSDFISDSIPSVFKQFYKRFSETGDKPVFDTVRFYDTLKTVLLKTSFPKKDFLWFEYMSDDFGRKYAILWTDDFVVYFNREYIARWHRKTSTDDSVIYKSEIRNNLKSTIMEPFLIDFEKWNENVTNRSYLYWSGAGGGFIFCSKVMLKSDRVEILHTVFRDYNKDCPFFYLKEQPEDNYKIRFQVNCDWIKNAENEDVVWFFIRKHKSRGRKVFDCEGNEIELEQPALN
jgi:hypothetical protein